MTAQALAAFADKPIGKMFGGVCQRWGIDPAADIEDDVLAFNFRAALAVRLNEEPEEPPVPEDPFAKAHALQEIEWPASS